MRNGQYKCCPVLAYKSLLEGTGGANPGISLILLLFGFTICKIPPTVKTKANRESTLEHNVNLTERGIPSQQLWQLHHRRLEIKKA